MPTEAAVKDAMEKLGKALAALVGLIEPGDMPDTARYAKAIVHVRDAFDEVRSTVPGSAAIHGQGNADNKNHDRYTGDRV